jgi:hypothetical protein
MMNVISPRVFEAVALRTALVLFPGEYSGAVDPGRHYISLAKDFSNFEEVAERLRDLEALEVMTANAYEDLIASGRYSIKRFVERFDQALDEHGTPRRGTTRRLRYKTATYERPARLRAQEAAAYASAVFGPGVFQAPTKVVMSLILALRTPQLRSLLWRYLAYAILHPTTASSLPAVFEDLLKLAIVYRIRAEKLPRLRGVQVTAEHSVDEVVLRSVPPRHAVPADHTPVDLTSEASGISGSPNGEVAALRRVTWDHSAIGTDIRWPLPIGRDVRVTIGEPGRHVHEFRSLPELAARFPAQVARVLP